MAAGCPGLLDGKSPLLVLSAGSPGTRSGAEVLSTAHSSRGLGRRPLTAVTRVRIPYALPTSLPVLPHVTIASMQFDDVLAILSALQYEDVIDRIDAEVLKEAFDLKDDD
jgi:hypothetical protein